MANINKIERVKHSPELVKKSSWSVVAHLQTLVLPVLSKVALRFRVTNFRNN